MIPLQSKVTRKLLNYFFLNPQGSLYVNELVRQLGVDKRNLVKKLKALETEGILTSSTRGNMRLYSVNTGYPFYKEYRQIILKSVGVEGRLRQALKDVAGVEKAYIYGSYAGGKMGGSSDIDVLVVGNHAIVQAQKKINVLQREIDREINLVHMDSREFDKKLVAKDPFVAGIMSRKHIRII